MAEGRTDWGKVEGEWFVEPTAATDFLLDRETFPGVIWDPCCGQGNILRVCDARAAMAVSSAPILSTDATRRRSRSLHGVAATFWNRPMIGGCQTRRP